MFDNSFFISLIGFLVVLTPLVFIHELGHYLAAIKNGVKVEQFSVGFGPELIGFSDKYNTRWKVCLIPFGGYVKMKGEFEEMNSRLTSSHVMPTEESIIVPGFMDYDPKEIVKARNNKVLKTDGKIPGMMYEHDISPDNIWYNLN